MPEAKILVIGLDNAGKTTLTTRILQNLQHPIQQNIVPTIGVETHVIKKGPSTYKIFDLGGAGHFRSLWELYASDASHIIIVIDAADNQRLFVIRDEIQQLVLKIKQKNSKILIVANKSDAKNAISSEKIVEVCAFNSFLRQFNMVSCSCSALQNQNVEAVYRFIQLSDSDFAVLTKEKEKE